MDGDHLTVNRGKEEAREKERERERLVARWRGWSWRRNEFPIRFLGISDEFLFFFGGARRGWKLRCLPRANDRLSFEERGERASLWQFFG